MLEATRAEDNEYPAGSDWHQSIIKSNLSISGDIFDTSSWMLLSHSTNLENYTNKQKRESKYGKVQSV